jgi:hypothetical protein
MHNKEHLGRINMFWITAEGVGQENGSSCLPCEDEVQEAFEHENRSLG